MSGERDSGASFEVCTTPGTFGALGSAPNAQPFVRRLGLWPALVLALLAFVAVSGLETFSLDPNRPVAVLFPSGLARERAFAAIVAAGGLPIRPGRSALSDGAVWIAAPGAPDFFDKVRANGAWAVINPFAFGGCFLVKPV